MNLYIWLNAITLIAYLFQLTFPHTFNLNHFGSLSVKVFNFFKILPHPIPPRFSVVLDGSRYSMANGTDNEDWSLYPYEPVKSAPIIFAILLTVVGIYQFYASFFRYKWRKFGFVMTWATLVWIAGFVCRAISVYDVQNVGMFIAQFVLIILGPPLYAAAEYFILGRLIAYLPYHATLHPGRVVTTFAMLSIIVESLTANGAANSSGTGRDPSQRAAGLTCLKAALILQCCIEAGYFTLVAQLEYRCRRAGNFPRHLRPVFYVLYTTSLMVLVRCIVRTIEGFETSECASDDGLHYCGVVSTREAFLWVFEIANITLFVLALAIFHPGKYLPRSSKIYLDPVDSKTERVGPGYSQVDKRPFLATLFDPFNLVALFSRKEKKQDKFWERENPIYNKDGNQQELDMSKA